MYKYSDKSLTTSRGRQIARQKSRLFHHHHNLPFQGQHLKSPNDDDDAATEIFLFLSRGGGKLD